VLRPRAGVTLGNAGVATQSARRPLLQTGAISAHVATAGRYVVSSEPIRRRSGARSSTSVIDSQSGAATIYQAHCRGRSSAGSGLYECTPGAHWRHYRRPKRTFGASDRPDCVEAELLTLGKQLADIPNPSDTPERALRPFRTALLCVAQPPALSMMTTSIRGEHASMDALVQPPLRSRCINTRLDQRSHSYAECY